MINSQLNLNEDVQKNALQLNIQDKQENVQQLSISIRSLNSDLENKVQRRTYLQNLFKSKIEETKITEKALKVEIKDVQEKLEEVSKQTQREKRGFKQVKDKNSQKLEQLEQNVKNMKEEQIQIEIEIKQTEELSYQQCKDLETKKHNALKPLEESEKEVQKELLIYQSRLYLCRETKEKKYLQLQQYQQEQKQIEEKSQSSQEEISKLVADLNQQKVQYKQEYEIFEQEFTNETELNNVIKQKQKLNEKIKQEEINYKKVIETMAKIQQKDLQSVNYKLKQEEKIEKESNNIKKNKLYLDISKLEKFIKDKEDQYQSISLQEVILEVSNCEQNINYKQINHLQAAQQQLQHETSQKLDGIEQEIKSINIQLEEKNITDEKRKWLKQKCQYLLEQSNKAKILSNLKCQKIQNKIKEFEQIQTQENKTIDLEQVKKLYLQKMWARMQQKLEKEHLQSIIDEYFEKVQQREKVIQQNQINLLNFNIEKQKIIDKFDQLKSEQQQIENDAQFIKDNIMKLQKKENQLVRVIEERQAKVEFELYKIGEQSFEEYFINNQELFEGVKKTYGKKVAEKIKNDQKKEFTNMTVSQYRQRINEIKEKANQINEFQQKISNLKKESEQRIQVNMIQSEKEYQESKQQQKIAERQVEAIEEALTEIAKEIKLYKETKDKEIKNITITIKRQRNFENQKVKYDQICESIKKKEKQILKIKQEIDQRKALMQEKVTILKNEELVLKERLNILLKGQEEVNKVIKPQLMQMEREVSDLNYQITTGKKKLEILFQNHQQVEESLQLAKQTLIDKYGIESVMQLNYEDQYFQQSVDDKQSVSIQNTEQCFQLDEEFKKMQNLFQNEQEINFLECDDQYFQTILEEQNEDGSQTLQEVNSHKSKQSKKYESIKGQDKENKFQSKEQKNVKQNIVDNSDLLSKVKVLIQGIELYKRFSSQNSIYNNDFDPLKKGLQPDQRGYGNRIMKLNQDLTQLQFLKPQQKLNLAFQTIALTQKQAIEQSIDIDQIIRVIVPSVTQDIIKNQKSYQQQFLQQSKSRSSLQSQVKVKSQFQQNCLDVEYYPISLVVQDKTLDFVAKDKFQFKIINDCFESLIKLQKLGNLKELKNID